MYYSLLSECDSGSIVIMFRKGMTELFLCPFWIAKGGASI